MSRYSCVFPTFVGRALWRVQGGKCACCGKKIWPHAVSVDHVIPAQLRGPAKFGNLVATHGACNTKKANRLPNGCELIWLLAVNARLGVGPQAWKVAA